MPQPPDALDPLDSTRLRGDQVTAATHIGTVPVPLHLSLGRTQPADDTAPLAILRIESPVGVFVFHLSTADLANLGRSATDLARRLAAATAQLPGLYVPS